MSKSQSKERLYYDEKINKIKGLDQLIILRDSLPSYDSESYSEIVNDKVMQGGPLTLDIVNALGTLLEQCMQKYHAMPFSVQIAVDRVKKCMKTL